MRKSLITFLAALIGLLAICGPAPSALAESGPLTVCLSGCRPGDAECINCCAEAFSSEEERAVLDGYVACTRKCESLEGLKALMCCRDCLERASSAIGPNARTADFDCPEWVAPVPCPDCQTWSLRRQQCVPAPKELCGETK
ncbi:hypothetical protein [Desulfovibrio sp. Fe33]|uniref:hypothetical protein n=1 Tax=Desulfovibrio sp. Fe33 TaxID=3020842 RepID=UPI00234C3976|nr:hypothetical protein [Desulfovibrio sp. Fe33]